jgi:hypothetical protein
LEWFRCTTAGDVAQLVERLVRNEEVRGSNPLISTSFFRYLSTDRLFFMTIVDTPLLLPSSDTDALLRTIGNTPLIPLLRIGKDFPGVRIFAKAEWFNPGGSVKDRAAYRMIRAAELSGKLTPGKIILDECQH